MRKTTRSWLETTTFKFGKEEMNLMHRKKAFNHKRKREGKTKKRK